MFAAIFRGFSIYKLLWLTGQKTARPAVIAWNHTVLAYGIICCFKDYVATDKPSPGRIVAPVNCSVRVAVL